MSDYEIYKAYGRVVGQKETQLKFSLLFAPWYKKPFIKFLIWIERVKRYIKADIKLKSDNPFGCLFWFCAVGLIFAIMFIGKLVL